MGVEGMGLGVLGPGIAPGVRTYIVLLSESLFTPSDSPSLAEKLTNDEQDEEDGVLDMPIVDIEWQDLGG